MGVSAGRKGLEEKAEKIYRGSQKKKRRHKEVRNENELEGGWGEAC
jgi:hypothetical protein